ncbi:gas vesicle protein GvpL [Natrialbaceae archaeon A-arb3/5]
MSSDGPDERLESADLEAGEPVAESDAVDGPAIDEGRYLYCIVQTETDDGLETTGVDGESVSVVVEDGIGAVVHPCDEVYDSADMTEIRRWLVRHQTVVDEAGEAFGTPIPFQFDTILRGDDDGVRRWLREEADTLDQVLSELAGHWEYRVEVVETDPIDDEALIERDERLRELEAKIDDSGEGTSFLLEKQFDQRVTELRAMRRESLTADLETRLAEAAREVHTLERSPSATLSDDISDAEDGSNQTDSAEETLCRLTLLAHEDDEGEIGTILDEMASNDGFTVKFTGPWPPYTFAPELGGDSGTDQAPDRTP